MTVSGKYIGLYGRMIWRDQDMKENMIWSIYGATYRQYVGRYGQWYWERLGKQIMVPRLYLRNRGKYWPRNEALICAGNYTKTVNK